jgi:hypothetical protein
MPDKQLQDALVLAAQTLAGVEGVSAFSIPVPGTSPQQYVSLHAGPVEFKSPADTPPTTMPSAAELRAAILVLLAAKHAGGSVDALNAKELERVAGEEFDMSPEELMDCVLSVGSGIAPLREFIEIR